MKPACPEFKSPQAHLFLSSHSFCKITYEITKIKGSKKGFMDFCDVCDSLLKPKRENGEVVSWCPICKEYRDGNAPTTINVENDARKAIENDPERGKMLVLEEDNRTVGRSSREMYCGNCKSNQEVEYWEIQTRSADESPTRFFKCLNCEKQWREYD